MRIISGFLKGRKINYLKNSTTRPLKDSVKENVFNILKHSNLIIPKIKNSNVLDLYSGVGSFGIECISRGADKVTFVEKDNHALNILKKNLSLLSILDKSEVFEGKIENKLKTEINNKYNIFFFDPPFLDNNFIENIKLIKQRNLFKKNHIVVVHRERGRDEDFNNILKILDTKEYSRSKIIFGSFY